MLRFSCDSVFAPFVDAGVVDFWEAVRVYKPVQIVKGIAEEKLV
jgi:hypothetical protein